ncbi:hypothetical protein [Devosia sp. 1566]|uniref:hypothetical protein n=1 Tax=Devosia sp. 1566 TaxID=2499144 RepID=UPI000FDCDA79|nr:hypothetical protein [Devosia sp. 1566]
MFLEGAFIASVVALHCRIRPYVGSAWTLISAAVVFLNPYTIRSFTEFQREPLLLVFYFAWFWSIVGLVRPLEWSTATFRWAIFGAFGVAIILTREGEELFVAAGFVLTCAGAAYFWFRSPDRHRSRFVSSFVSAASPTLAALAVIFIGLSGVAVKNGTAWGDWHYRALLPSYQALLTQLHRIEVDDSTRFAPATRKSFQVALDLSPTFAEFARRSILPDDQVEGTGIHTWRTHSSEFVGRREIDPTRTLWLIAMLVNEQYGADDRVLSAKMNAAAAEIESALDAGRHPSHSPTLPYPLDPNFGNWVGEVPGGLLANLRKMLLPRPHEAGFHATEDHRPELYDNALNRRQRLVVAQYQSNMDEVREWFVGNYWLMLLVGAIGGGAFGFISRRRVAQPLLLSALVLTGVLGARYFVYTIMSVSVLPVDRYHVFMSPLAAVVLLLWCWIIGLCCRLQTRGL